MYGKKAKIREKMENMEKSRAHFITAYYVIKFPYTILCLVLCSTVLCVFFPTCKTYGRRKTIFGVSECLKMSPQREITTARSIE